MASDEVTGRSMRLLHLDSRTKLRHTPNAEEMWAPVLILADNSTPSLGMGRAESCNDVSRPTRPHASFSRDRHTALGANLEAPGTSLA
jgi:hypothetical protein